MIWVYIQILACELKIWVLLLSNLGLIYFTAQTLSWRLCPRMSCNLCPEPNEIITKVLIGSAFFHLPCWYRRWCRQRQFTLCSVPLGLNLVSSLFGLVRPMSRLGSIVIQTSAVSTMAGCDANDDKWSFLLIRLKKNLEQNRLWKQLLSPWSINGTITTRRRSYCYIFSFELTWKGYILNHGYQMKGNSMKTQRYTDAFWTFYLNP